MGGSQLRYEFKEVLSHKFVIHILGPRTGPVIASIQTENLRKLLTIKKQVDFSKAFLVEGLRDGPPITLASKQSMHYYDWVLV